jgi:hypothetical protein
LIRYGEGPHISAFSMLGFCLAAAWLGVRGGRRGMLLIAGFFAALTVSNNFYGATALALFFPVLVWVAYVEKQSWVVLLRGVSVAVLAWGWTAWWLTPTYLSVTLRNMRLVSTPGNWWSRLLFVAVLAAAGWLIWRFGRGRADRSWLLFVAGSLGVYAFVVLGNYHFAVRILGESLRLVPELDLCFILAAAMLGAWLWARGRVYQMVVVALLVLAVMPSKGWLRRSWQHIRGPVDYTQRVEYQVSKWVHDNLPGQRVLAIGSYRFWYNAWFDLPQTGGGSEQGSLNLFPNTAYFAVTYGVPNEDSLAWLRATGTDAFTVSDEKSVEVYHDFAKPHVFEGFFPVLYDDQKGNRIYRVPRKFPGIVRVVEKDRVLKIPRDERGDPKIEVAHAYAAALEEGPNTQPEFTRVSPSQMRVKVRLEPGQALEVLETFDSGWEARNESGAKVGILRDPFDFMMVDAGAGEHTITLEFMTPFENRVGRMITIATILLYLGFGISFVGRR